MQAIATFSIETESVVLVQFSNGRKRRIAVTQLRQFLADADVEKIIAAYKLRDNFIDSHMPRTHLVGLAILGATLLGLVGLSSQRTLAQVFGRPTGAPQVLGRPSIAKSLNMPTSKPAVMSGGAEIIQPKLGVTSPAQMHRMKVKIRGGLVGASATDHVSVVPAPAPDVLVTPLPVSPAALKRPGVDSAASVMPPEAKIIEPSNGSPVSATPTPLPTPPSRLLDFTAAP